MTHRAPLHVRIPPREWQRELLTWVARGPQLGIQSIPDIQSQGDWLLPVVARPNLALRSWLNGLPPGVIANPVPPIRNYDWPNPTLRVQSFEQRTWIHSQQISPSVVMPFAQNDWPNPRGQLRNQDLSWAEGLPQTALALTLPLRQLEWPNPVYARANLDLRSWIQKPQLTAPVALPFNQSDWPLPAPARPNLQLRSWSFSLQIQPQVQRPFNQFDWPNPAQKPFNLELRAWRQSVPQSVLSNPLPPIRQRDWPNPRPRAANLELRTWAENFSIQAPAGLSDTDVIVPYLIEDLLSAALMRIASIYCTPVVIGTTGSVTIQDPAAFTRVPRGTTITITLGGTIKGSGSRRAQAPYGAPDTAPPFPDPKINRH